MSQQENAKDADLAFLPFWPETVRSAPNGILRSALFGAIGKGRRQFVRGKQVAALEGITLKFTGETFDQVDLDCWLGILHAARNQRLGSRCLISAYALLKGMGKTDSGKNRQILHESITRLVAGAIELTQGRYTYIGSLINEAFKDEASSQWIIELNPRLRALFEDDQYTQMDNEIRWALRGKPLAQWLHGFYSSHARPYPIKVETLHRLCGSKTEEIWKFKQTLQSALESIRKANEACGQTFSWRIENNIVHVRRNPSETQRRHLKQQIDIDL